MYNSTWTGRLHNIVWIVKRKYYSNKTNSTLVNWSPNLNVEKSQVPLVTMIKLGFWNDSADSCVLESENPFWLDQFRIHDIGSPAAKPSPWRQLLIGHWWRYRNHFRVFVRRVNSDLYIKQEKWCRKNESKKFNFTFLNEGLKLNFTAGFEFQSLKKENRKRIRLFRKFHTHYVFRLKIPPEIIQMKLQKFNCVFLNKVWN